ncbi:hypothetical protein FBEOM_10783 [Fusarium beomiforme]|uniref:Uncharacterized protein n=1 Tax=Fusarium beomiforme TaxID=44412 RepID=A0A9P5ABP3_9HYPO|nr:hypothetical protein FBEOM_10783 [Fusarium beomiforme]
MLKIIHHMSGVSYQKSVMFHMLTLARSYHDSIERVCCTRWAMQVSEIIKLPNWITGVLREICIFELIKSTWHQGFNRYAWVVAYDLKDGNFSYHDPEWRRLGNVFSIAAKLILHHPEDSRFWIKSMPVLVEGCYHIMEKCVARDDHETDLGLGNKELKKSCYYAFVMVMEVARAKFSDEQASERRKLLERGLEARAKKRGTEVPGRGGEKRKNGGVDGDGDGGEGNGKKQKMSAA